MKFTNQPFRSGQVIACGVLLGLGLSGCGGDSDSPNGSATTDVGVRFSDAPVENAEKVVIEVDYLEFRRDDNDPIRVDQFTSDELGITDAETFKLDLLEVQDNDSMLVLDMVELPVGDYQDLRIGVLDEDVNFSFVEEVDSGLMKPIKVPSDRLKLGRFSVEDSGTQTFVVEFSLRQSMTYNPGPERYILKPRGVRIVDMETSSDIGGTVDLTALHSGGVCQEKGDPAIGNVAYLYAGHGLDAALLGDDFVRESDVTEDDEDPVFDPDVPEDAIGPLVSTGIDGTSGDYMFSFLEAGDYTLAITCVALDDDPVLFDGIAIPAPDTELVEITLGESESFPCDFPLEEGQCAAPD